MMATAWARLSDRCPGSVEIVTSAWHRSSSAETPRLSPIAYRATTFFPAAEVMGVAQGIATGTALHRMEELAHQVLPPGIGFEWTELAFQQQQRGDAALLAVWRGRAVRVPGARRTIRELEIAARGGVDRTDVPTRFGDWPLVAWDVDRRSGSDRLRCSRWVWPPRTRS